MFHHGFDLFSAALSFLYDRDTFFFGETILYIDVLQQLVHRDALIFSPGSNLGQNGASGNGIFVANEIFAQETVAFFAAADIVLLAFVLLHDIGNPFETGVNVIHFDTVLFCDRTDQFGRDDCLHDVFFAVDLAEFFPAGDEVVDKHQSSLVAVQQYPFAVVVLNGCTYAVCIRVGSQYQFGIRFLGLLNSQSQSGRFFRVGGNDGREVAAYYVLFGNVDDIRETERFQCRRDNRHACSVDRCVDDLHVVVAGDGFR